jgi:hypothetical protein
MAKQTNKPPDFFEENPLDPVSAASGGNRKNPREGIKKAVDEHKRKAGFYLSAKILDRFNRKFYELKLEGLSIVNKSALLEAALAFALDDMDKGNQSKILSNL